MSFLRPKKPELTPEQKRRLPPGQVLTEKWPVLHASYIPRFDPKTQKFQSWTIPGGGNIVRNTDVTKDGNFVLANSLVNTVTLVTIPK